MADLCFSWAGIRRNEDRFRAGLGCELNDRFSTPESVRSQRGKMEIRDMHKAIKEALLEDDLRHSAQARGHDQDVQDHMVAIFIPMGGPKAHG
jgi:hypothetical protein